MPISVSPRRKFLKRFNGQAPCSVLVLAVFVLVTRVRAQAPATLTVAVEDSQGSAVEGAIVANATGETLGRTAANGRLDLSCAAPCRVSVSAPGFAAQSLSITAAATIRLQATAAAQDVTVTAYRVPMGDLESPATTRTLSQHALAITAAITLDDQMRQLPGVEMFRRSSFARGQSHVTGSQPARPRIHFSQPHAGQRRRCSAQRSAGRLGSLAGTARVGHPQM